MRNLSTKGLSMSQAQSISNMCNQRAQEIANKIGVVNNAEKTITIGDKTYIETRGNKMPADIIELINEKATLHACQGFLMEALKAKDAELNRLRRMSFVFDTPQPVYKEADEITVESSVDENWGWAQLSDAEYAEYLDADSKAAHIGQFIHKNGKLDKLRIELPTIKSLEWITVEDGKKTPVEVTVHHNSSDLLDLHEKLALQHRELEQRVNYYKAKVKNLVTVENARIHAENMVKSQEYQKAQAALDEAYTIAMNDWRNARAVAANEFEKNRELAIKDTAALRINVDPRFQPVIDMFIVKSED